MTRPGGVSPRSHSIQWASNFWGSGGGLSMAAGYRHRPSTGPTSARAGGCGVEASPCQAGGVPSRPLVLASASPARLALLRAAGLDPLVVVSGAPEDGVDGLGPEEVVRTLADRKATAVAARLGDDDGSPVVVGCDSALAIGGEVRGRPSSAAEARAWWRAQRGRTGTLYSGHAVVDTGSGRRSCGTSATVVRFGEPSDAEVDAYLATGEPLSVAGAFTIEGYGAPFVTGIEGDHGTVLGLSLPLLRDLLAEVGVAITDLWVPR